MGWEFCDQRGAHSICEKFEEYSENGYRILDFKDAIPFSFTSCYGSFKGCYPLILDDGGLGEIFQETHISMIKAEYCYPKRIKPNQTLVLEILSFMYLDL
jgi:hypothetical protein